MSRCGSNDTSHSGWRPNRRRTPAENSWRWPRRLPATWSTTTRTGAMVSLAAEPPRDRARDDRDHGVRPPGQAGRPQAAARRALDLLHRQGGLRESNPDLRAQDGVLAGHRDRGGDRRGRQTDPRREPAGDVGGRGQGRVALLLRVELTEARQIALTGRGRQPGA